MTKKIAYRWKIQIKLNKQDVMQRDPRYGVADSYENQSKTLYYVCLTLEYKTKQFQYLIKLVFVHNFLTVLFNMFRAEIMDLELHLVPKNVNINGFFS